MRASSAGPHKGSTFRVELPLAQMQPRPTSPDVRPRAGAACRVFVVDDNLDAAHTLRELLELMGHTVTLAHDARGALGQVAAAAAQWDVFILDIGLPDMTGYELAERLRAHAAARNSTFVALTGYGQAHDRVISRTAGFHHHLVKPADLAVLGEILSPAGS